MTPQEVQEVQKPIAQIAAKTVDELKRLGLQHSCVYAGALLTQVLHCRGFSTAYPLTVRAFVLNPELHTWAKANHFVIDGSTEERWSAVGGRFVALGEGRAETVPTGKWLGHLAVVIPNYFGHRHAFLDLTVPQVNQPQWKIVLPSVVAAVSAPFVRGEEEYHVPANASLIMYTGFPDDRSYTEFPLWKDQAQYAGPAERIIAALA